jgi:hypothetical protein
MRSIARKQPDLKMGKESEQTFLKRHTNGQQLSNLLSITNQQGNAN